VADEFSAEQHSSEDANPQEQPSEAGGSEARVENNASADEFFAGSDQEIENLKTQLLEAEKRVLVARADLENFRSRMRRQHEDELKYANLPLISDLLPVLDNLTRAIDSAENSGEQSGILDGVKMIQKQLKESLAKRGCTEIEAIGQPFDPNLHEAILQQPSAEVAPGTVLTVTQTGYKIYERVVRPSQVIVSQAPPTES